MLRVPRATLVDFRKVLNGCDHHGKNWGDAARGFKVGIKDIGKLGNVWNMPFKNCSRIKFKDTLYPVFRRCCEYHKPQIGDNYAIHFSQNLTSHWIYTHGLMTFLNFTRLEFWPVPTKGLTSRCGTSTIPIWFSGETIGFPHLRWFTSGWLPWMYRIRTQYLMVWNI